MLCKYNRPSWWWAQYGSKHVEEYEKNIINKECIKLEHEIKYKRTAQKILRFFPNLYFFFVLIPNCSIGITVNPVQSSSRRIDSWRFERTYRLHLQRSIVLETPEFPTSALRNPPILFTGAGPDRPPGAVCSRGGPLKTKVLWLLLLLLLLLTHWGRVTQICVFTLQLCKTDDANLRF